MWKFLLFEEVFFPNIVLNTNSDKWICWNCLASMKTKTLLLTVKQNGLSNQVTKCVGNGWYFLFGVPWGCRL